MDKKLNFRDIEMVRIGEDRRHPCQDLARALLGDRSAMAWIREHLCTSNAYIATVPRDNHPFYRTVFDEDQDESVKVCYGEYHANISETSIRYYSWKDSIKECVDEEKVPAFLEVFFRPFSTMPLEELPRFMSTLLEDRDSRVGTYIDESDMFRDFIIRFRLEHGM